VAIEYRWAENQFDRFPALLADLVRREVTVIVAVTGTPPVLAAKAATTTIPIVFVTAGDPVALGLVASLNRPGGNLTGVATLTVQLGPKQLEILHELVPTATIIALLVNPTNATNAETLSRDLQAAARTLGLQLHVLQKTNAASCWLRLLKNGSLPITSAPARSLDKVAKTVSKSRSVLAAASSATETALRTRTVRSASTPAVFSRARSPLTCRSSNPRRSS
jgi:hypothetical protein